MVIADFLFRNCMKNILKNLTEIANGILREDVNTKLDSDFQKIAGIIKQDVKDLSTKKKFAYEYIYINKNNPRFNKNLFLKACGLPVEQPKTKDDWSVEDILRREG